MEKGGKLIAELFEEASLKNPLNFIFAILRVGAWESYEQDPLVHIYEKIRSNNITSEELRNNKDLWCLIIDLSRIGMGDNHKSEIFRSCSAENWVEESKNLVSEELSKYIGEIFLNNQPEAIVRQIEFTEKILEQLFIKLRDYPSAQKIFKLPRFEALELLINEKGLYGFRIHFSNDSKADFQRTETGTVIINLMPEAGGISFMCGEIDKLKEEWRINGKRLYEIGLPGKYNNNGEWKPLEYPGDAGPLEDEARQMDSNENVQGILFYMFCTGHRVIEFAIKTAIKLPQTHTILPGNIHLDFVEPQDEARQFENEFIYDGWLELYDVSVEGILSGLKIIRETMSGLAFTFDKHVQWNQKYILNDHSSGASSPNSSDSKLAEQIISKLQINQREIIIAAISWYNLGLLTQDPLNKFLCYHFAIEGLAVKLGQGDLLESEFFGITKESKEEKNKRVMNLFEKYLTKYQQGKIDINEMISNSYFEGVVQLRERLRKGLNTVFGENHATVTEYVDGKDSMWRVRSNIAHGEYAAWDYDELAKLNPRIYRLEKIVKEFITRVMLRIKPEEECPGWEGSFSMSISGYSPKSTVFVTTLDMLPLKEWVIRPEWIN